MSWRKLVWCVLMAGPAGFAIFSAAVHSQRPERPAPPVVGKPLQFQGSASCASAACHHGNGPPGTAGSEYTTWSLQDPHSGAWRVLLNEQSQQIAANLKLTVPPSKHELCLNCHVQPGIAALPRHNRFALQDGVSCESCHGPAEKWLDLHHRPEWKTANQHALGMHDTRQLETRAETCVQCHVGKPGMEVNHDLIAAGHPPLRFEFAAFQVNLPKHWQERGDNQREDFEARSWLIGQLVSARTAIECLAARAASTKPWPELADFDCFACHHDLKAASWRSTKLEPLDTVRRPGSPAVNKWYVAMLDKQGRIPPLEHELTALQSQMSRLTPDRGLVAKSARQLGQSLNASIAKMKNVALSSEELHTMQQNLMARTDGMKTWEEMVQIYLGLSALSSTKKNTDTDRLLKSLAARLGFPDGYNSPREFAPADR